MFSVVIPLYDKVDYIQRSVESVFKQTSHPNEILIVDDGSTDGGGRLVQEKFSGSVKFFSQENQGVSVARNRGLQESSQPYVAFLDADDEWKPGFLQRMCDLISEFPDAGLYASGYETCDDGILKHVHSVDRRYFLQVPKKKNVNVGYVDYFSIPAQKNILSSSSMVVDRKKAWEIGGFPEGVRVGEDFMFWINMALKYPVAMHRESLAVYHTDASGVSRNFWNHEYKRDFPVLPVHRMLMEHYDKQVENGSFRKYCRRQLCICMAQRMYNKRFDAALKFYDELKLKEHETGWELALLDWIARKFAGKKRGELAR
jgi:glycosyltransferase involved in cell wall biosynthesis